MNNLIALIKIRAGHFRMGSPESEGGYKDEGPQRLVEVPSFLMGKYPVTQAQWKAVAALPKVAKDLKDDPAYFKGDDRPVECVSWYEVVEFCQRLSRKTGREYRLPSEAEWEYACRADTTTPFHVGKILTKEQANFRSQMTTPVCQYTPSRWGLHDMHGNVWEWCQDHWHDNYAGAPTDGSAWLTNDENASRVCRGGSWLGYPWRCRSAYRYGYTPDFRSYLIGFRVVCSYNEEN